MLRLVRNSKGFTLVELAIVLVIIGIILGAVLKGQELINNAKMKGLYNDVRGVTAAMYTYMDRYGTLPGDDNTAGLATRWTPPTYYVAGNGNGQINGGTVATMFTCAAATATETCGMWDHLRQAQIISGAIGGTNPKNSYGGTIGVASVLVQGLTTNWVGVNNVPSNVARDLDVKYDDGDATTGQIRAAAAYANTDAPIALFFRF